MSISKTSKSVGIYELATGILKENIMEHERRNKMGWEFVRKNALILKRNLEK
jgi:hypothetical protein